MGQTILTGLLLLVLAVHGSAKMNYGYKIGDLVGTPTDHGVSGTVYIVNSSYIFIKNFYYDGKAPDVYFWISRYPTSLIPDDNGRNIPDEYGSEEKLSTYNNKNIALKLPYGVKAASLKWISIWCKEFSLNFGSVIIPDTVRVPQPTLLGDMSELRHDLRGKNVTVLNERTIKIDAIYYDGTGPDAYFVLGTGWVGEPTKYFKIPDETGSFTKTHGYNGMTIVLHVPHWVRQISSFTYFSLYCIDRTVSFGDIQIPSTLNVSPLLPLPHPRQQPEVPEVPEPGDILENCEALLPDVVNVAWQIHGPYITIELSSVSEADDYVAFGLSGNEYHSRMLPADVVVTSFNDVTGMGRAVDYTLNAYQPCSNSIGACPDTEQNGRDDIELLKGSRTNKTTTIRYKRTLKSSEPMDKSYNRTVYAPYIVWAKGKLDYRLLVTKHTTNIAGDKQIHFERAPERNCQPLPTGVGWAPRAIDGLTVNTFWVKIGPTGGEKGYKYTTGRESSGGMAYYINKLLIPTLTLVRGRHYTFVIETGNDPSSTTQYNPFYITTSSQGGYARLNPMQRLAHMNYLGIGIIGNPHPFALGQYCAYEELPRGRADSYNTFEDYFRTLSLYCPPIGQRGTLRWTPDSYTPDELYYQSYTNFGYGWKIKIIDDPDVTPSPEPSPEPSTTEKIRTTTTTKTTTTTSYMYIDTVSEGSRYQSALTQGLLLAFLALIMGKL